MPQQLEINTIHFFSRANLSFYLTLLIQPNLKFLGEYFGGPWCGKLVYISTHAQILSSNEVYIVMSHFNLLERKFQYNYTYILITHEIKFSLN